ncbi:MAG: inositol monophosphatase family protein, partial [Marinilabiliaceae bacterium]|nr:inositol monophosphatase family protein [Marinilabiliaceae bacterium]
SNAVLSNSLVGTGFPYKDYGRLAAYLDTLEYMIRNTRGVRRQGSAAVDLAHIACGRLDAFFEYNLNPWDVSAGTLIIREAGGRVTDFRGNEQNITGKEIIAANNLVYLEFQEAVKARLIDR